MDQGGIIVGKQSWILDQFGVSVNIIKDSIWNRSMMEVKKGYLLISDISGYTEFLVRSELQHAKEILDTLLETGVKLSAQNEFCH